ncbi:Acg family FMN-binding oxidoreductase [Mycobacterium branderi]|uniref:NAD(P)H nitroreductase n=1 Tax=Mycobacterium branderi TaxID=43348 RepID=A0A7I7W6Y4_9MYCO|nr:nitroreductase family protein [Mycobacterium branderi]MCV7231315.1 nitroreductase family protein [Mycobacterium branderi]ORA31682.1 NAD(P)H nitroreductase [Mycobacterium branderi]BBZ12707.1 NAD(P)H nitroreductase [Mycobacterium branderi]
MSATFPDAETIRTALTLATQAPSVHNTQPWLWRVGDKSIHLYSNKDLQLHSTDPDGRDLMISCGISLNHCVVAFAALGWLAKVHRFPNPADNNHLAAIELMRCPATDTDIALAAAIPRRRTDRRRYSSQPVPAVDITLMGSRAARLGVMLRKVEALGHLSALVAQAALRHAESADYLYELTTWSGRYASQAGVPARNAPQRDPEAAIPRRAFAGPALHESMGTAPTVDNAVVMALGTRDDDALARLRAGEATSLVLLTATSLGLASCPITEPLEIPEIREEVRTDVFGTSGFPQMLLRVGWPPAGTDPLPATPRRPLGDVVTRLDGTPFE